MTIKPIAFLEDANYTNRKLLAVLFDPDDAEDRIASLSETCETCGADMVLLGGSLLTRGNTKNCLDLIRKSYSGPIFLFPGDEIQVVPGADGILLLSLISGRNAEYLIGKHVLAAPLIRQAGLPCLPTGYMLIDGGRSTTAHYISQTMPIPADKAEIAAVTALAGVQLGMKLIYLDAGSGALQAVDASMIRAVSEAVECPVIAGGGIRSEEAAASAWQAGATVVVVGNGLMQDGTLLERICTIKSTLNKTL
ncbi:MAG: geranylgeranylglyceryl/heptaprenylglyceryl phosphate synthase [Bacteroidetes bacterium]|nr:geranylgeranylglyceryl/heptaprenylglyceryl phosphate synthase [Bacteroidota bacterium]